MSDFGASRTSGDVRFSTAIRGIADMNHPLIDIRWASR
jgi:hypothetical protein